MKILLDNRLEELLPKLGKYHVERLDPKAEQVTGRQPVVALVCFPEADRGRENSPGRKLLKQLEEAKKQGPVRTLVLWQGTCFDSGEAEDVWMHFSTVVAYTHWAEFRSEILDKVLDGLPEAEQPDGDFLPIGSALKMPPAEPGQPDHYGRHKFVSLFIGGMDSVLREVRRAYQVLNLAYPALKSHPFERNNPDKLFASAVKSGCMPKEMEEPGPELAPHILISGETGTGKTLLARWLHQMRKLPEIAFQDLNCGALPENLIEVQLFGAKKGAYTGLDNDTPGKIWCAYRGTLFLDEIGELPKHLQPIFLKYLDDASYYPVHWHGHKLVVPTAVMAASNRKLEERVQQGKFREDLLHRFRIRIQVPPLRERRQHFEQLVDFVLQNPRVVPPEAAGLKLEGICREALAELKEREWPGNFRQLEQVLWRAAFQAREEQCRVILPRHLSPD